MSKDKKKLKIKNMKLEQNELQSTTIGVFENRKKSSIGVVILLAFFIAFVFYLPEISNKVGDYLNPTVPEGPVTPKPNPNNPTNPGGEDDDHDNDFYDMAEDLKIERDDIIVSNFYIDTLNNTLSYSVTNNTNAYIKVEDLNYYLELYTSEGTLLERVKLTGDANLASGSFKDFTKPIKLESSNTLAKFSLVKKQITDYPTFNLKTDEDGNGTMVCKNLYEQVTYKFKNNALKEVVSEVSHLTTDNNYEDLYQEYKNLSYNYSNKSDVVSIFMDYEGGFKVTTNIDLSRAARFYVFNADTFKLDTESKVVAFEMGAQGFDCE